MSGAKLRLEYRDAESLLGWGWGASRVLSCTQAPGKAVAHPEGPGKEVRTSATLSGKPALPPDSPDAGYWPEPTTTATYPRPLHRDIRASPWPKEPGLVLHRETARDPES